MSWTDMTTEARNAAVRERIERQGLSYSQTAAELGATRVAIASVVYRAGINTPPKSSRPHSRPGQKTKLVGGAIKAIQESARKARSHFAFGEIAPNPHPVPPDDKPLRSSAWLALPGTTPVDFGRQTGCKWPLGDGSTSYLFCNEACAEGSPYCPTHRAIAYKPAPPVKLNGRRKL